MDSQHAEIPLISVIIPSYNSRKDISCCLDSILGQTYCVPFEVIIVDSSEDNTAELIKSDYPSVTLIELSCRTYPGEARNIGVRAAQGGIIVFSDTDCVVGEHWLDTIAQQHQREYRVIGGAVCNGTPGNIVGTAEYLLEFNEFTPYRREGEARLLPTCNVSLKKEIFQEYGDLENVIKGSDTLFTRKLIEGGERIYFSSAFTVSHKNRTCLTKFLKNQYDLGIGSAQIRRMKKMPGSFLTRKPLLIPLVPFVRMMGIGNRLLRQRHSLFWQYLVCSPLILLGLLCYAYGFLNGARRHSKELFS